MAYIKPFRAIVYNKELVDIKDVVAPPYDVITPKEQLELYKKSNYNIVRIILNKENPELRYKEAKRYLERWLEEKILIKYNEPVFFLYRQSFSVNGKNFTRNALVGVVRIHEFKEKIILPHEKTLTAPKEDRYKLIKSINAQPEPIFGIVIDDGSYMFRIEKIGGEKLFEFEDENGVTHKLYLVERTVYEAVRESLKTKKILIADGHHRYETALRIKREYEQLSDYDPEGSYNYVLMCLVSSHDKGLIVQPIYRVFEVDKERLKGLKNVKKIETNITHNIKEHYSKLSKNEFIMVKWDGVYKIWVDDYPKNAVSTEILQSEIIEKVFGITQEDITKNGRIRYHKKIEEAIEDLKENSIILIYNPPSPDEISKISEEDRTLPQKSTYFYPKFYSGLFMYPLD